MTDDHFVDVLGREPSARERRDRGSSAKFSRMGLAEGAAVPANRRTRGTNDHDREHEE
jgi:hypothetical protein